MHPATSLPPPARAPSLAFRCALALLRALRSTAIIVTVALLAFAVRAGDLRWSQLSHVAQSSRFLFGGVFFLLLLWELRPSRLARPAPAASPLAGLD